MSIPRQDLWDEMKKIVNEYAVTFRPSLSREYLMRNLKQFGTEKTIDTYRANLTAAGYMVITGRGIYEVLKTVPSSWSIAVIRRQAYGKK
jgi:hypothetical protein